MIVYFFGFIIISRQLRLHTVKWQIKMYEEGNYRRYNILKLSISKSINYVPLNCERQNLWKEK